MKLLKKKIMKLLGGEKPQRLSQSKPYMVEIEDVGLVNFKRSYRAKRLILRIKEEGSINVSVPRGVTSDKAINFVIAKTQWINRTFQKMSLLKKQRENSSKKINLIDREIAKKIIIDRVVTLANQFGFSYERIFIKNQKTIWGSCSSKNNLNFNYKIASLPKDLMDYVILHELVHTKVKNHSKLFWNTLDKYINNSKSLRNELKNIHI